MNPKKHLWLFYQILFSMEIQLFLRSMHKYCVIFSTNWNRWIVCVNLGSWLNWIWCFVYSDIACSKHKKIVMLCALRYHLYNLKNVNTSIEDCYLSNAPSWVFFTFILNLYNSYQIVQSVSFNPFMHNVVKWANIL